jgi:hypothetical protein
LRERYISAGVALDGPIVFVQARVAEEVRQLVPIASILSEVVFFDCSDLSGKRTVSVFPIGNDVSSPVLYASGQDDPETGRRSFASLRDAVLLMATLFRKREDGEEESLAEFGVRPFTPEESWTPTPFFRTAEETRNDLGQPCTVAVGITHLRIPEGDNVIDDVQPLLDRGSLAYFPCSYSSSSYAKNELASPEFQKIGSMLLSAADLPVEDGKTTVIAVFNVPYIETTCEIACRKLAAAWDSFRTLRMEIAELSGMLQDCDESIVGGVSASNIRGIERELANAKDILKEIAPGHLIRTASVTLEVGSQLETKSVNANKRSLLSHWKVRFDGRMD